MNFRFFSSLYSFIFALISIISLPKLTLAQLRFGTGIQPGLEGYFLEYQQRGLPLEQLRSISECSVGLGASCNKTAAILQQIVERHSGLTHQDLLIKAAGGQANYQRFSQFYPNSSAIPNTPHSSFWLDRDNSILDSYENSGIGTLSNTRFSSLHEIVSQFKYAPVTWDDYNLSLRQGLVGLKTSYGLTLIEEAIRVPDINQKIADFSANDAEAAFHQGQFRNTISALNSQYYPGFDRSLFSLLSNPYTDDLVHLNRPNLSISDSVNRVEGITLEGEERTIFIAITGEGNEILLPDSLGVASETINPTPIYVVAGIGGLTFLLLALTGVGDDPDSSDNSFPDSKIPIVDNFFIPIIEVENQGINTQGEDTLEIPEPANYTGILILSSIILLFSRKKIKI